MSPCCLYIFSPSSCNAFCFRSSQCGSDSLPKPPCWGQLVWHSCKMAKKWEEENWLELRKRTAKMRADSMAEPFPSTGSPADADCTAPSLPGLYPSLLWLKIATGLRVTGKGEVSTRLCKYRAVSSFVDQVDIWNALDVQIINKPHWANWIFPVETIYINTLLTFLRALFCKVMLTLVGIWESLHTWCRLSLLKDTVACIRSVSTLSSNKTQDLNKTAFSKVLPCYQTVLQ